MQNAVKVLIVEDEPNALAGLAELISGWGYRTETARDGIEGWEKALAWEPAIVVTDLKMPRMDGMGLLAKLSEGGVGHQRQHGSRGAHRHGVDSGGRGSHEDGRVRLSAKAGRRDTAARPSWPTPRGSAKRRSSWKWRGAACARPGVLGAMVGTSPQPCARSSA